MNYLLACISVILKKTRINAIFNTKLELTDNQKNHNNMRTSILTNPLIVLIFWGWFMASCQSAPQNKQDPIALDNRNPSSNSESSKEITMQIYFLNSNAQSLKNDQTLHATWQTLLGTDPSVISDSIALKDINIYKWDEQSLVLNEEASEKLREKWGVGEGLKFLIKLDGRPFVVTVSDIPIYTGKFIQAGSPRVINQPVIYIEQEDNRYVFIIRPSHPMKKNYPSDFSDWNGIKDERIRKALELASKLK